MRVLNGVISALTLCILGLPITSVVRAEDAIKTIVVFQPDASKFEIDAYLADWATVGVGTIMSLDFIKGHVLHVPAGVPSENLCNDPIVASCAENQRGEALAVWAAGDGGSGDGGSGDGGSGDGGSGDGGSGDGGSGDGGSGDGGSGDGGSGDGGSDAENECRLRFVSAFDDNPSHHERPWGVLDIYEHSYDPNAYLDTLSKKLLPDEVVNALRSERRTRPVRIAVLDTGIDFRHPRLKSSVRGGVDLVNFSSGIPTDDNGHGTHVAGTIAAKKLGVASRAELYAVKILDSNAEGDLSTLLMALQWAIDNEMDVANMSIGFRQDEPVARLAVQKAYEAGMVLVAATGNHSNWDDEGCSGSGDGGSGDGGSGDGGSGDGGSGDGGSGDGGSGDGGSGDGGSGDGGSGDGGSGDGGSGDGGSGDGGNTGNPYPVMYPAKYPQVIAVGAMDSDNGPAPFSNTGPELDLIAPGVDTVSTHLGRSFGVASGTSMSSAHVSGAVALMVAVARDENKSLSPAEVKRILRAAAMDGTINLVDALNLVTMQPPNGKP